MKRPQLRINLRRVLVGLWLASIAAPGVPVLCVGATGHAAFEYDEASCCVPVGATASTEFAPASADDDCIDCSDFLVARESTPGRRDPAAADSAPGHVFAVCEDIAQHANATIRPLSAAFADFVPAFHISIPTTVLRR